MCQGEVESRQDKRCLVLLADFRSTGGVGGAAWVIRDAISLRTRVEAVRERQRIKKKEPAWGVE